MISFDLIECNNSHFTRILCIDTHNKLFTLNFLANASLSLIFVELKLFFPLKDAKDAKCYFTYMPSELSVEILTDRDICNSITILTLINNVNNAVRHAIQC